MPRRNDIHRILLIGSGPIVIGQACEFDYSGTQGAKALKDEGYEVILVNSNPATVMTDPEFAHRTYIEPISPAVLEAIIARERPDALLPTLGGQTALNNALALHKSGVLEKYGVQVLGVKFDSIEKAEDRALFKEAMERIGLECPRALLVERLDQIDQAVELLGFPIILRPSFTLGGTGGGIVYNVEELENQLRLALKASPVHSCLVEESVLGWKEYELEVIRDCADNFGVICTIENFDPMGVHTGDSITVAPAMTLTDKEYQRLRDAARRIISEIGVETGGSNIQFAVDPKSGRFVVIEMNPRVSRSSALASKATGYPIAKIAAKLAVGYRLDELRNDITGTSAAFEPTIDYVVCKVPRFAFEKFPGADPRLTTQMKSVGEVMSIGKTFKQALNKALRSLELGRDGLVPFTERVDYRGLADALARLRTGGETFSLSEFSRPDPNARPSDAELRAAILEVIRVPLPDRIWYLGDALRLGVDVATICAATGIDPWFVEQLREIIRVESDLATFAGRAIAPERLRAAKELGFSDSRIASITKRTAADVRKQRREAAIEPVFARVDTCAAEFPARTPYFYSTWGDATEVEPTNRKKIAILGGGPNRIGQGIEFDYCCVHAALALRALDFETIMVNCNPETVSTDFDTSDRLYFEPLTFEDVMAILDVEKPAGVIVQFGGQTPLKLALPLDRAGIKILGTSADAIDRAEDRERFDALLKKLNLRRPRGQIAHNLEEMFAAADAIGYPVLVRPSYVLGGRAMEIVHSRTDLARYAREALQAVEDVERGTILVDHFLKDAIEFDVDCISDGTRVFIGGVMQHIEEAGIHSGDSTSVLPPHSIAPEVIAEIKASSRSLALELGVIGLMNVQFAVQGSTVYVIEVNPRASRTVPFVSKAIGLPLAKIAAQVMAGKTLDELGVPEEVSPPHVAVKESVFPFSKFPGVDVLLSPEMRSTGEVMGVGREVSSAFLKALWGAGMELPTQGRVFISVRDDDKVGACDVAKRLQGMGFELIATEGTAKALARAGVLVERVNKVHEGRPHCVDRIRSGDIDMVINTTVGAEAIRDSFSLRRETLQQGVPYFTTMAAARMAAAAIETKRRDPLEVRSLQEFHG